jgi:hypothetical protein
MGYHRKVFVGTSLIYIYIMHVFICLYHGQLFIPNLTHRHTRTYMEQRPMSDVWASLGCGATGAGQWSIQHPGSFPVATHQFVAWTHSWIPQGLEISLIKWCQTTFQKKSKHVMHLWATGALRPQVLYSVQGWFVSCPLQAAGEPTASSGLQFCILIPACLFLQAKKSGQHFSTLDFCLGSQRDQTGFASFLWEAGETAADPNAKCWCVGLSYPILCLVSLFWQLPTLDTKTHI